MICLILLKKPIIWLVILNSMADKDSEKKKLEKTEDKKTSDDDLIKALSEEKKSKDISELEEEILETKIVRENVLSETITPTLRSVEIVQDNSLEEQVLEERPTDEPSDRRTSVDYGAAFTTGYITSAENRERAADQGAYVIMRDDLSRSQRFHAKDFAINDPRMENHDKLHRANADIEEAKYERKRMPFERKEQEYYSLK